MANDGLLAEPPNRAKLGYKQATKNLMSNKNQTASSNSTFIADGRKQIEESESYQQQAAEIRARIEEKYQAEYDQANFFQKWFVDHKMRREIRREVEKLLPHDTLFSQN